MPVARLIIIDYGMGNLGSVRNALAFLGQDSIISNNPAQMLDANAFVLPGVGAFGEAMRRLQELDLVGPLAEQILTQRKPLLGICLGMQLLAEVSSEHGHHRGLGWIRGHVLPVPPAPGTRIPHVGWSEVSGAADSLLFRNIDCAACFYFDHSYYLECDDEMVIARTHYGIDMTAAIRQDNIFATQFHPEKSQRAGLKLMRNFLNYCAERYPDRRRR